MNPSSGGCGVAGTRSCDFGAGGPARGPRDGVGSTPHGVDPRRWHALAVSLIAAFMALLDGTNRS